MTMSMDRRRYLLSLVEPTDGYFGQSDWRRSLTPEDLEQMRNDFKSLGPDGVLARYRSEHPEYPY